MSRKNKLDNLEEFFHRVLNDYEENPSANFWTRVEGKLPAVPPPATKPPFKYKGWMLVLSFVGGILLAMLLSNWYWKTQLVRYLETTLAVKNKLIQQKNHEILTLEKENRQLVEKRQNPILVKEKESTLQNNLYSRISFTTPKKANRVLPSTKDAIIKLEIARNNRVVAAPTMQKLDRLQPFFATYQPNYTAAFTHAKTVNPFAKEAYSQKLLFDDQLITNSFFAGNTGIYHHPILEREKEDFGVISGLYRENDPVLDSDYTSLMLTLEDRKKLLTEKKHLRTVNLEEEALVAFLTASVNPFARFNYNLEGYKAENAFNRVENSGIISSVNWSIIGGVESKSKWSFHAGIDYNKLSIVKESINNVRYFAEKAMPVNGGYLYSINQRSDGALGQVIVNTTVFNQKMNDGQDLKNGDIFKLLVSTEQPLQIIRMPILVGYRFNLSRRLYLTTKLGVSPIWKKKEQTQFRASSTFYERLSVQNSNIFLTSKHTEESLDANFRVELGYRWRSKWYLVAEPRFKYSAQPLFSYKDFTLKDAPFQLMVGLRYNID